MIRCVSKGRPGKLPKTLPEVETDADGRASLAIDLNEYTEGTYRLNINVDGLELTGGRGVSASAGMLVSPNASLVGFKADGDLNYIYKSSVRQVRLVAVDSSLQPIALSDLKLSLYQREYVSSLVQMPDRTYRYKAVPVEKETQKRGFFRLTPAEAAVFSIPKRRATIICGRKMRTEML